MATPLDHKLLAVLCAVGAGACQWKLRTRADGVATSSGGGTASQAASAGTTGPVGYDRYNIPIEVSGPIEVVEVGRKAGAPLPDRCAWRPWVVIKDHTGGGTYGPLRYPRNDNINNALLVAVAQKVGFGDDVPCDRARKLVGAPALMKAAMRANGKLGSILAVQWIDGHDWEVLRDDNTGNPIQQVRAVKVTYEDSKAVVPPAPKPPTVENLQVEMSKKIGAMVPAVGDLEYLFGAATIDPHLDLEWTDHFEKAHYVAHASFTVYQRRAHEHGAPWQELRCGPISVLLVPRLGGGAWDGAPFGGKPRCGDRDYCSVEDDCVAVAR